MKKIVFDAEYFNVKDTLECGQVFRFKEFKDGYLVFSLDKCCYAYNEGKNTVIECEDVDYEYFYNYFDLRKDYSSIYNDALKTDEEILVNSAKCGKGIRILNQDKYEAITSFIVSQNNNIPRIKGIIEKLCKGAGEKKSFFGNEYYSFPDSKSLKDKDIDFFKEVGLGYRAEYVKEFINDIENGFDVNSLGSLTTAKLHERLLKIKGVGPKVADCAVLFGYHRGDAFPVDTWIEKVYSENFNGELKDRKKIAEYFVGRFKNNSGYFQQYLFYYKRNEEKQK